MHPRRWALCALVLLAAPDARADEGMWTFDNFPTARVKSAYGHAPDAAWLEHVRLSSARLGNGCSGSFVSAEGLVLTNHHCVMSCVQQLSTKKRNLIADGFVADKASAEARCPALDVNRLTAITDVTDQILAAVKGKTGPAFIETRKATIAKLESECAAPEAAHCEVVSLYRGGRYHLYRYHRYADVRLVMAPELAVAFFGGDPDNFNFPRYNLDFSFLRVYEGGAPAKVEHFLKWSKAGPKADELAYVSGHPGHTDRLMTVAQLAYLRDYVLPESLMSLGELRGRLAQFSLRGPEQARVAKRGLLGVENAYKAYRGRRTALVDQAFFSQKAAEEAALQAKVAADPEVAARVGDAWGEIARAIQIEKNLRFEYQHMEPWRGYNSQLFRIARTLVRWGAEKGKPSGERLSEFSEARLPRLKARLFSKAPIYPELETDLLTLAFEKMQRELGADHPFVKDVLQKESPRGLAVRIVKGTKLGDVSLRKKLFGTDPRSLANIDDPMLALARVVDPYGRRVRKRYEDEVEAVVDRAAERIAAARFAIYGTEVYPDATGSLRLSFGSVRGFQHLSSAVHPFTDYSGLFARATGNAPFALPKRFRAAKGRIDPKVRLNFVTTNDIIGGNSGSPVVDASGELVGLVFDGNIYSLGGAYGFDERLNRTVAVHSGGLLEAIDKVYGARRIVRELRVR